MADLKFAYTHNLVAFLSKPAESKGTVLVYYQSQNNEEVQLQALVDGKKIIVTEASARSDVQLDDEEGMDCQPNATIFEQLTLMGYRKILQRLTFYKAFFSPQWKFLIHTIFLCLSAKTTAWNEFSSTIASAIICLAINQKFNFSKYIFESMVKNLENVSGKFLMYPRRVGKGFSGRETPLFQTMLVQDQADMGEGSVIPTDPHHTPTTIQPSTSQPQRKQRPRKPKRKDIEIPQSSGPIDNVADEAVNEEMDDSLERATTTATSLDAEQDRGNINKTKSKETPNEPSSLGTSSGGGPRRQETIGDTIAQTRSENVSKLSNDPLLARGNTLRSGEDSLKLEELMALCTTLQQRVLDLETIKTTQGNEIASLRRRVKKQEKKDRKRTHGLKRLYKVGLSRRVESSEDEGLSQKDASKQGRIADIDADAGITLASTHFDVDTDMFGVHDLDGDEVIVYNVDVVKTAEETVNVAATIVSTASTILVSAATITDVDITLAQALAELKISKAKGLFIHEQEQAPTSTISLKDKGKEIMVEEPLKMKKKDQINFDEQEAIRLQAKFDEEERLAREKDEANVALTEEYCLYYSWRKKETFASREQKRKGTRPPTRAPTKEYHVVLIEKHRRMDAQKFVEQVLCHYLRKQKRMEVSSMNAAAKDSQKEFKESREEWDIESSKKQKVEGDNESESLSKMFGK
ncbi:hypothetical protein Tco_0510849 [Tanacetum coccineum]